MALSVYLPRTPLIVNRSYRNSLERRSAFTDNPAKGQEHFFRGVRQSEKKNFLNGQYSIGPHDQNPLLCGFHHAEVFGWWFNPKEHQVEIDDDDVFWEAAVNLTPDHLDLRSKMKLIREFALSPSRNWPKFFGPDWTRAYQLSQTDPIAVSLLDAEDLLLGLRFRLRDASSCIGNKDHHPGISLDYSVDINTSVFLDIFDFLEKSGILNNTTQLCEAITEKNFLHKCFALSKELKSPDFHGNRFDLISNIITTAFFPVPGRQDQAHMNMGNFASCLKALNRIDPASLRRQMLDSEPKDPLFFIFANSCKRHMEVERDIHRFDF